MARKAAFEPIYGETCRILLLGSLPGDRSLAEQRYYGHPRNLFWKLIGRVIMVDLEPLSYEERLAALVENRIGLWDVFQSAEREGSLDTHIRAGVPNKIDELCEKLPLLRAVAFNGSAAYKSGAALVPRKYERVKLLSSSPANAGYRLDAKMKQWCELRVFLPPILSPQITRPMDES